MDTMILDIETTYAKSKKLMDMFLKKHYYKYVEQEEQFRKRRADMVKDLGIDDCHEALRELPPITPEFIFVKYAPLHPEFGQICCISYKINNQPTKSVYGEDEKSLLKEFCKIIEDPKIRIAGYNIKGFDIPFIIRRLIINSLSIPPCLMILGKKPWEITMVDICDDYRFGMRDMVPLETVCLALGVPTSKDLFANHEMNLLLWLKVITLQDVAIYCEKDVEATYQAFCIIYSKF